MTLDPRHGRLPGVFANLDYGLYLRFQFNPTEMTKTKETTYEIENLPGVDSPYTHWSTGGPYKLNLELFFSSQQSMFNKYLTKVRLPNQGTLGEQAILESFLKPARSEDAKLVHEILKKIKKDKGLPSHFVTSPPECYFFYGPNWYRGLLLSAPITETAYDGNLAPQQFTSSIDYLVLQEGALWTKHEQQTRYLALSTSGIHLANTAADLTSSLRRILSV